MELLYVQHKHGHHRHLIHDTGRGWWRLVEEAVALCGALPRDRDPEGTAVWSSIGHRNPELPECRRCLSSARAN